MSVTYSDIHLYDSGWCQRACTKPVSWYIITLCARSMHGAGVQMRLKQELYGKGWLAPPPPHTSGAAVWTTLCKGCLHLATLRNCHRKLGLVAWIGSHIFHLPHNQQALTQHAPKHNMLVVKPVCLGTRDEELAAI